jgi:hypothetical protein
VVVKKTSFDEYSFVVTEKINADEFNSFNFEVAEKNYLDE